MENFKTSPFSPEQQETYVELLKIVEKLFTSSVHAEEAYDDVEDLKQEIKNPEQYYLWNLLDPTQSREAADYNADHFDQDGKIEAFIRKQAEKMDGLKKVK